MLFTWYLIVILNQQPVTVAAFRDLWTCKQVAAAFHWQGPALCLRSNKA